MSEVRKYKALGDMTPRSRIGGGEWVRLEDYDAAQVDLAAMREELSQTNQALMEMTTLSKRRRDQRYLVEDLLIWKRRALEAEAKVREQNVIIDRLSLQKIW